MFFSATELETTPGKFWHCGGQSRSDWMKSASYDFSSVNDDEAVDVVARIKDTTDDYDDSATGVGGAREEASATDDVRFVATVGLVNSQVTYTELQEDQNVLVYVPQGNFHPGSRFKISVKLQVQSDLKIFSIRLDLGGVGEWGGVGVVSNGDEEVESGLVLMDVRTIVMVIPEEEREKKREREKYVGHGFSMNKNK